MGLLSFSGTLGGIASLISGITIINVVEVIVVFVKKLRAMCEDS